ncbi:MULTISPECIES: hypothetical protein [Mesonia]|uniref:Uncharacterized protein n=1 Tax=Mesonia oceanica TaxID=2687242 RepID=A0AC61YDB4_9FLAO|nr:MULTISPECIES: hypothetical protein [Mesonia]MAN26436.1 hypothetical protein [Mesonia sp.]MAQ39576.1 hypothetical protein [Mesonia sp.]MBJ99165.1 hypothetical protein [Flavobacteriaceae bacterium]VVV02403.1 hypothetical protein FVB9532_03702 [Mesonia oceanica]|tara:strand:+ start:5156 stop:5533 length:378 start_codon:yes stop_codon:yes gene_type:complete
MKKILTVFSIALGLFLCTSVAHAQDKEKIKEKAKQEAYSLSKDLGLDKAQQRKVAENYYSYYLNTETELSEKKLKADKETYLQNKQKFDKSFHNNMEKILSPVQMKKFEEKYNKEISKGDIKKIK